MTVDDLAAAMQRLADSMTVSNAMLVRLETAVQNHNGRIDQLENALLDLARHIDEFVKSAGERFDALTDAQIATEQKLQRLEDLFGRGPNGSR